MTADNAEETLMNTTHRQWPALRWLTAGVGLVATSYASHAVYTWLR
jgi:hypothetical protein